MERIFLRLVPMSLTAGWLVLAVLLLRLMLKKAPRRIGCLLWLLVALRLLCPMQIAWRASLVPPRETVERAAQTTLAQQPNEARPAEAAVTAPSAALRGTQILSCVWLAGMTGMLLWLAVSDLRLRRRLRSAVRGEANIRRCSGIDTPFVLGVFRPRIYLPPELDPAQTEYVLAHERAHIARGDHLWKLLGWLLLSVYWFHPLLWLAYVLMCRDLELACDEAVAKGLDRAGIADYAETLLDCGCRRRGALLSPVAFGEVGVKARVKAVLRYRKPTVLWAAAALVLVAAVGAFFLTERPAAVELSETRVASEDASIVAASEVSEPDDDAADDSEPDAEPQPAQSSSASSYAAYEPAPQQTQDTTDTVSVDAQAQIDAMVRADNERYAQENRAIIAARQANGTSVTLHTDQNVSLANGSQTAVTGPQPLVAGADSSGNPNPTSNLDVTWNGNYPVIRAFP